MEQANPPSRKRYSSEEIAGCIAEAKSDAWESLNLINCNIQGSDLNALIHEPGVERLRSLYLSDNQLSSLPPKFSRLTGLTELDLSGNKFSSLPPKFGRLTTLTKLNLSNNQLSALPQEFGRLNALRTLNLSNNQLSALPQEFGRLNALWTLNLSKNNLSSLPLMIGDITALIELHLGWNRLSMLPPEFSQLSALNRLDLRNNQFSTLPTVLGLLPLLERLLIAGNPLPAEIIKLNNTDKLIGYLREIAAKGAAVRPFNEAKLLLIGPGEVGKTWLLQALQGRIPQPTTSTIGVEIARAPLDVPHPAEPGRILHFNCWDFGGQDHYQITHQIFFSPKAVYLLVWKPRPGLDPDVFARLERIELSAGRTARVFLVSTHADDPIPAVIGEWAIRERFGDLIGGFIAVDSARGPEGTGIAALKAAIGEAAATLEGMDTPFPESWHFASAAVRKTEEKTLTFKRFLEICETEGMQEESAQSLALIMDAQGHAVHFAEAATDGKAGVTAEDNLVVLDPEWLAKAVAMVLEDQSTREAYGVLQHKRLPAIWKEAARYAMGSKTCLCGFILWLMWKFDIAYRLDEHTSLVPELIQRNRPDGLPWTPAVPGGDKQATLIGRIPVTPPPGLIPVFTAAVHPLRRSGDPVAKTQDPWDRNWRNGFFLDTLRRGTAFVELADRDLRMTARGDYPAHLLFALHRTLENVIEGRWPNLNPDYRIPCSGLVQGKACPGSFRLSYLEQRRGKRVSCEDCGSDEIHVNLLLDGYDVREQQMMNMLRNIQGKQQDLMTVALRLYHDVLDPARPELLRAPCMISVLPDGAKAWDLLGRAAKQYYRVTCWCEHPDGPHPGAMIYGGAPPDYRLEMPKEWVAKAAPYVSWFVMLAKTFVPMAGKMVDIEMGGLLDKELGNKITLMGELAKALPSGKLDVDRRDDLETGSIDGKRPEIVALRHIHDALLAHVPEGARWGDLRPVHTKAHGTLWLCAKHAAIQEPPVQKIS